MTGQRFAEIASVEQQPGEVAGTLGTNQLFQVAQMNDGRSHRDGKETKQNKKRGRRRSKRPGFERLVWMQFFP